MILFRTHFTELSETGICDLKGGVKDDNRYFIGILEKENGDVITNALHAKLQNQMGSQRSPRLCPKGYEPFETHYGMCNLILGRMTLPYPALYFPGGTAHPTVRYVERHVVVLEHPSHGSGERELLKQEAERTEWECKVRKRLASQDFDIGSTLLCPSSSRSIARAQSCEERAQECERWLMYANIRTLIDLDSLLAMPATDRVILATAA